jgi:polyhydroxybutyrate depolymerase
MTRLACIATLLLATSLACADKPRDVKGTLHVGGLDRTYRVHLPRDTSHALPLVVALHGGSWQGPKMELVSELDVTADRHGFIVVYPDAVYSPKPVERQWADGRGTTKASHDGVDDVAFIAALIDKLSADYKIDPARVYATGISNGGFMSYKLACDLGDRIAAIAPVSATMPQAEAPTCKPARPLAVLDIHGTADPLVPYGGGEVQGGSGGAILSVADTIKMWAAIDGCDAKPATSDVPDRDPRDGMRTHRDVYAHCKSGTDLVLYTVDGGGHTWPGGGRMDAKVVGPTTRDFDASEAIWDFFAAHRLPQARTAAR